MEEGLSMDPTERMEALQAKAIIAEQ